MSDLSQDVPQLVAAIQRQHRTIERLLQRLEHSAEPNPTPEQQAADQAKPRPVNWDVITGQERQMAWEQLAAFVEALVVRHNLQFDVSPCWWRHRDAVELLTALWQVYQVSYGDDADRTAAMSWLDTLYRGVGRLQAIFVSCREEHIDATPKVWMSEAAWQAFRDMVRVDSLRIRRGELN